MLPKSFKAGKCKTSLKLAIARIKLLKNKREVQVKQMRRDLAQLLETGQDQTARIRVEHVIREEKTMSAYDLIELYCELIVARLSIIESQKNCPIDLKEAICSVIFASPRCADIPELLDVRKLFIAKYGKGFATSALELRPDCGVNRLIVEKLSAKAPDIETKIKVLTAIAKEHDIKWEPKSFEEQVQKPSDDLLSGPTSFTNKMPVESSTIHFPPSPEHKTATKPTKKDMDRSTFGSNAFSPTSVEAASQRGPRAAASTYNHGESGDTYLREEVPSSNQQKWTMEFKDATSAAQAAAESAERASMAARAAAELASRGNDPEYSYRSRESSIYGSKHETENLMGSNLRGESLTRDSARRDHIDAATYATKQRMPIGLEAEGGQDHAARESKTTNEESDLAARDSKTTNEEFETATSQYSRIVSSRSVGSSSEKDAIEANRRLRKIGKADSPSEKVTERHPVGPVSSYSSNHSHDGDVPLSDLQKSDSYSSESFFRADLVNQNLSGRSDIVDAGRGGIERKSSKSLSSHSSDSSIDHEMVWDSPIQKNFVNQHSVFGFGQEVDQGGLKHSFSDDAPVFFDQSDSENDNHLEIDNFIVKDGLDSTSEHSEANFHISSRMDYSSPDQKNSGFNWKDGSSSSFHSVSRLQPAESSGMARRDNPPSQSDPVVYDVSDVASSDSEVEMDEFAGRGDTGFNSLHKKKNAGNDDARSFSRSSLKDVETIDKLDQFSSSFTDADADSHSSYVGGPELNFGRLLGGLRNKGYVRPPYVKNPVVDESLPSETATDDSPKFLTSLEDKTARFEDVSKNVNNWKPHFKANENSRSRSQNSFDSDTVEAKDLEQHPASRSGYRGIASLLTSKLDDNLTVDTKKEVSSTFMKPESNTINEEKPHQRSFWRTSRESNRTSAVPYIDKDTEKQPLSTAGHQLPNEVKQEKPHQRSSWRTSKESNCTSATAYIDDTEKQPLSPPGRQLSTDDTSSILSNQKNTDTKTAVSSANKMSGRADIYDKKSSVRTFRGSTSSATAFLDEENDMDEVLQPRDTVGNLGIRSGRRPSQRARGSKVDRVSVSGSSDGSSRDLKTPDLESKSLESISSISETPLKPLTTGVKPEKNKTSEFLPPNLSIGQHPTQLPETKVLQKDGLSIRSTSETPLKPSTSSVKQEKNRTSKFLPPNLSIEQQPAVLSEAEVLAQKDGLGPSQRSLSHNNPSHVSSQTGVSASNEDVKPSTSVGGSTSRENSLKGSHVHPKLPDYDSLADYFKSLRSNRR